MAKNWDYMTTEEKLDQLRADMERIYGAVNMANAQTTALSRHVNEIGEAVRKLEEAASSSSK